MACYRFKKKSWWWQLDSIANKILTHSSRFDRNFMTIIEIGKNTQTIQLSFVFPLNSLFLLHKPEMVLILNLCFLEEKLALT